MTSSAVDRAVSVPGQGQAVGVALASAGRRVVQFVIDWLAVVITTAVVSGVIIAAAGVPEDLADPVTTITALVAGILFWVAVPTWSGGQTLGMLLLGVRVVLRNGSRAGLAQHLVRWLVLIVDGLVFGLVGFMLITTDAQNRRLGDRAAETLVIRVGKGSAPAASARRRSAWDLTP